MIKTYDAYHKKGFEIIGISLDKDQEKLASFTKEKNMTWPQYFDGLVWQNKLAVQIRRQQHPGDLLARRPGHHHRQRPARRRARPGGRRSARQEIAPAGRSQ